MIALIVMTDGRGGYLTRTLASFDQQVTGPITRRIIHDDSGDPGYADWLAVAYPTCEVVSTPGRSGYGGAMRSAWRHLSALTSGERWVFSLEDDFVFRRPVDLTQMVAVLEDRPHLAQMALRRQAWNQAERAAGGVVEANPDAFSERVDDRGREWLEHRLFFTANPCLYRRSLCTLGWPNVPQSEGVFAHNLLRDGAPGVSGDRIAFGYWGARGLGVWVEHIGHQRNGTGY